MAAAQGDFSIPEGFPALLKDFAKEVLRTQARLPPITAQKALFCYQRLKNSQVRLLRSLRTCAPLPQPTLPTWRSGALRRAAQQRPSRVPRSRPRQRRRSWWPGAWTRRRRRLRRAWLASRWRCEGPGCSIMGPKRGRYGCENGYGGPGWRRAGGAVTQDAAVRPTVLVTYSA